MPDAIHISTARKMLDRGQPVSIDYVRKRDGSIMHADNVVSLRYDFYSGLRTIKCLRSGQKRTIHDVCIIAINEFEVFL